MATFEAQVEGLTSLSIDGSSAPTQTELTQFLTDGAKEILTALPQNKKSICCVFDELSAVSCIETIKHGLDVKIIICFTKESELLNDVFTYMIDYINDDCFTNQDRESFDSVFEIPLFKINETVFSSYDIERTEDEVI